MSRPKRNPDGTFPKGVSGNPDGRPKKEKPRHRMPAHNRAVVFEVAESPVQAKIGDESVEVSAYRGVMMALAKKAMSGHTPSARLFLQELRTAAAVNGEQNSLTAWLFEEQERMQAELDRLHAILPKFNGGVMHQYPDGRLQPAAWETETKTLPTPADSVEK
ncbi:DUF5681 domain-containing protein [Sphingomonas sp. LY54]|uniref:DUF5681 domain-containing protein n=1 Tax=Sphingomonas sp. LY54 TaxID=3095343 RepID=UPI002D78FE57|nr:DUF5681 domain-containing protein [Sphingomonas sp. LY54]WRP29779.1 DUF5681 domain-containing protein [Sphingomonas sp. LY54]